MTTRFEQEVTCSVCGQSSQFPAIGSTNEFGSRDLDTRPAPMMRDTIDATVQACPSCGYCAGQVSQPISIDPAFLRSETYRSQRIDTHSPALANQFLCSGLIQKEAGNLVGAGWSCLHAAWACDDAGNDDAARRCRLRALEHFFEATWRGETVIHQPGGVDAIIVDLLRRAGSFDEALEHCGEGLAKNPPDIIRSVLEYQKGLIARQDGQCYTIAHALGKAP